MSTITQGAQSGGQITVRLDRLLNQAKEYHKTASWENKRRSLEEALDLCDRPELLEAGEYRQEILSQLGGVLRRLGRYRDGISILHQAINANANARPVVMAGIWGEMGVMYRQLGDFEDAQKVCRKQFDMVKGDLSVQAEAEMCRAVGNEGMCVLNRYQLSEPKDEKLLAQASELLAERVNRARKLIDRLEKAQTTSDLVDQPVTWLNVGLARLSLCHIATGQTSEAVRATREARSVMFDHWQGKPVDPTVSGFTLFFLGNAMLAHGHRSEALRAWAPEPRRCSPAISLCKEPSAEHAEYLRRMADCGVDFDTYDEQGSSALEYAILSNDTHAQRMVQILDGALRTQLTGSGKRPIDELSINAEMQLRHEQAELRRCYRGILQEEVRPQLRTKGKDCVRSIRRIYSQSLRGDPSRQEVLDFFYYIKYDDFKRFGSLPVPDEASGNLQVTNARRVTQFDRQDTVDEDLFIVFFSYRWMGVEGGVGGDCACISQNDPALRAKGINALPLALTQCNAMISLVEDDYYTRAWCCVEVELMQQLIKSYYHHEWWQYHLDSPEKDRVSGRLIRGVLNEELDIAGKHLSKETLDRPKVEFLLRQSKLLGRDDAA